MHHKHALPNTPSPTIRPLQISNPLPHLPSVIVMGQCGSKQDYDQPMYPAPQPYNGQGYGNGDPKYNQYAQEQYQREQYMRQQQQAQKKKRSRMNGIVAAAAGAA